MRTHYLETRGRINLLPANMAADVMRHFHARQHLGRAVVIGERPEELLALGQRQWMKLSRVLQRRRGAATNAVEILKYTYTIAHMQRMELAMGRPQEQPQAHVHFVRAAEVRALPMDCLSLYVTGTLAAGMLATLVDELPASALVVDYVGQAEPGDFGLRPKGELEVRVAAHWQVVEHFLAMQQIQAQRLVSPIGQTEAMDDALDALLAVDTEFLHLARSFQRTLDLARPLRTIPKAQRDLYEAFMMLAHRFQGLVPGGFSTQFLNTYADDTFFLSDNRRPHESLAEAIARHERAGRWNVARALMGLRGSAGSRRLVAGGRRELALV